MYVKSLLICQLNSSKSIVPMQQASSLQGIDILLTTEPPRGAAGINKSEWNVSGVTDGRALILSRKSIRVWPVNDLTDGDTATVAVQLLVNDKERTVYISSVYADINLDAVHPFRKAVEYCNTHKIPHIIGSDSNSHSSLWGMHNNPRGDAFEDFAASQGLTVHNVGTTPTFERRDGSNVHSIIDITVSNRWANDINVADWQVERGTSLSDHNYIFYKLGKYVPHVPTFRNYKKIDWLRYRSIQLKIDQLLCKHGVVDKAGIDDIEASDTQNWTHPHEAETGLVEVDGRGHDEVPTPEEITVAKIESHNRKILMDVENLIVGAQTQADACVGDAPQVEICGDLITNIITTILNALAPRKPALTMKPMSWWTKELATMRDHLKLLNNRRQNEPGLYQ